MSAKFVGYSETSQVDAIVTRRAFCALAGAALVGLAGCASQGVPAGETQPAPSDAGEAAGEARDEGPVQLGTFAFDTYCTFTAYGVSEGAVRACVDKCAYYENLFSARKEGTDIWRLNQAKGEPVEVDPETADLLQRAVELAESSDGLFDPTVGTVSLLWDFPKGVKPDDEAIVEALAHVGWHNLQVEGTTARLLDGATKVDLGGIAKGWIAGRLNEDIVEAGATAALINLGTSSIYALGKKPDGSLWKIGLRDPLDSMSSLVATVEVCDESLTSSGLYDQQFEVDGTYYWHILDPKTGYPAQTDVLGDTVVCADPVEGDATSTVLFMKGAVEGPAWLVENRPHIQALCMCEEGRYVFANGFENHGFAFLES